MSTLRHRLLITAFLLSLGGFQAAVAATITTSLGNASSGLVDGSTPPLTGAGSIFEAQNGQAAPFNQSIGADVGGLFGGGVDFSANWTFNYAPVVFPEAINGATIEFGIFDIDSAASGSQVASFIVDGIDYSAELNDQSELANSGEATYNVFSLALGSDVFANLADGSALISLALQGPGLVPVLFGGGTVETTNNGANLIYSTLSIETAVVPIPAAAPLFLTALAALGFFGRRARRNAA